MEYKMKSQSGRAIPWFIVVALALAACSNTSFVALAEAQVPAMQSEAPLFDALKPETDVIYLIANSSLVFGPDPAGHSEEITFVGPVTVPKWPLPGYSRRNIGNGVQEIDLELTESLLTGESYLLGGSVVLGEDPNLRSMGWIRSPGTVVAQAGGENKGQAADTTGVTFRLSSDVAATIDENREILSNDALVAQIRELATRLNDLRRETPELRVRAQSEERQVNVRVTLPIEIAELIQATRREINWDRWVQASVEDLIQRDSRIVRVSRERAVIPSDFTVMRKVMITTAKGVLYNETPVPVRGRVDSIPPVRLANTPAGINIFQGMELPVALLDEDKNINGWFYSKAHMAYAVLPKLVERDVLTGKIDIRVGDKTERVIVEGKAEIHHDTKVDLPGGAQTPIEVLVLALRGDSELLGGKIMVVESFSDKKWHSSGQLKWTSATTADAAFDLFVQIYVPSGKLQVLEPLKVIGSVDNFSLSSKIERGTLHLDVAGAYGLFKAKTSSDLFDENTDQLVARITSFEFRLAAAPK
jgi:hypothetical protein